MMRRSGALLIDTAIALFPVVLMAPVAIYFNQGSADFELVSRAAIMVSAAFFVALFFGIRTVQCLRRKPTTGQRLLKVGSIPESFIGSLVRIATGIPGLVFVIWGWPFLLLFYPAWVLIDPRNLSPGDRSENLAKRTQVSATRTSSPIADSSCETSPTCETTSDPSSTDTSQA